MSPSIDLRPLAADESAPAPYGFDEFERRRAVAVKRRRAAGWSIAASLAVFGLVGLAAVLTQRPEAAAQLAAPVAATRPVPRSVALPDYEPALVDLGQFAVTSDIEDHIALLDDEISAARVYSLPAERLREMESARAQLNDSLQRVSYAHALLSL